MLFKKPHKIVYEVTSDSYVKIPPPFPNSSLLHTLSCTPPPVQCNKRTQSLIFLSKSSVPQNSYSLLCVFWFPLWFFFFPPGFLLIPTWVSRASFGKKREGRDQLRAMQWKVVVMKRQLWYIAGQIQVSPPSSPRGLLPGRASLWIRSMVHPTGICQF